MTDQTFAVNNSANSQIEFTPIYAKSGDQQYKTIAEESNSLDFVDLMIDLSDGSGAAHNTSLDKDPEKVIAAAAEDDFDKLEEAKKDRPLTRTEALIVNQLENSIAGLGADSVQEGLQALNEQPGGSRDRVMRELANRLQKRFDTFLDVDWESGTDSRGQSFTRMHLSLANDSSKSSGHTRVTIGSDGPGMATVQPGFWNTPRQPVTAEDALERIGSRILKPQPNKFSVK